MKQRPRGRLQRRDHSDNPNERVDKAPLSAILPRAPNTAGANINWTPSAALSRRFHGAVTP
jgi:hypothetical protein